LLTHSREQRYGGKATTGWNMSDTTHDSKRWKRRA
jgi:hypothetical protein